MFTFLPSTHSQGKIRIGQNTFQERMTFALRAFWVLSPNEEMPVYERVFRTVEMRAQQTEKYQKLPKQRDFVDAVLIETGIKNSDTFILSRDRCDKKCIAPAFQISIEGRDLEPVVILQHRGLLLCALPLVEDMESSVLEVAQTLDCLNTIAEGLSGDLSQRNELKSQLTKLMVTNFPFGRPQTENATLTEHILEASVKTMQQEKTKVPVWNPSPNVKGKNSFAFAVSEQIHSLKEGEVFSTGVISVTTNETSEIQPEITLTVTHPGPLKYISLAPRAQIENVSDTSTTIKFNPTVGVKTDLMHYSLECLNPISCFLAETGRSQTLVFKPTKVPFQKLEIKFPAVGAFTFTVGKGMKEENFVKWDIPVSKLKAKDADVGMTCSFDIGKHVQKLLPEVTFKLGADVCWSGIKIVPNTLLVNGKTSKIKCSIVSESMSGNFRIGASR